MVQGIGWCGVHRCPPDECFVVHNPTAFRQTRDESSPDLDAALAAAVAALSEAMDVLAHEASKIAPRDRRAANQ